MIGQPDVEAGSLARLGAEIKGAIELTHPLLKTDKAEVSLACVGVPVRSRDEPDTVIRDP